jgi:hypothetical protein
VPAKSGSIPGAPFGGHKTQFTPPPVDPVALAAPAVFVPPPLDPPVTLPPAAPAKPRPPPAPLVWPVPIVVALPVGLPTAFVEVVENEVVGELFVPPSGVLAEFVLELAIAGRATAPPAPG